MCTIIVVPGAATVIIMVCVGFLVVMVILGVFRIRSIHRRGESTRGGAKEGSGQWDDSALTIIVNPMEVITVLLRRCDQSKMFFRCFFNYTFLCSHSLMNLVWASLPTRRVRGRRMKRQWRRLTTPAMISESSSRRRVETAAPVATEPRASLRQFSWKPQISSPVTHFNTFSVNNC